MAGGPAVPAPVLLTGRVVTPEAVLPDGALVLDGGLIRFAGPAREVPAAWRSAAVPDGWTTGRTLLPGAVDVHCHGGAGGEFGADAEGAATAARHHHRSGTTTLLGSLVSGSRAALVDGVRTLALARRRRRAGRHPPRGPVPVARAAGRAGPGRTHRRRPLTAGRPRRGRGVRRRTAGPDPDDLRAGAARR